MCISIKFQKSSRSIPMNSIFHTFCLLAIFPEKKKKILQHCMVEIRYYSILKYILEARQQHVRWTDAGVSSVLKFRICVSLVFCRDKQLVEKLWGCTKESVSLHCINSLFLNYDRSLVPSFALDVFILISFLWVLLILIRLYCASLAISIWQQTTYSIAN